MWRVQLSPHSGHLLFKSLKNSHGVVGRQIYFWMQIIRHFTIMVMWTFSVCNISTFRQYYKLLGRKLWKWRKGGISILAYIMDWFLFLFVQIPLCLCLLLLHLCASFAKTSLRKSSDASAMYLCFQTKFKNSNFYLQTLWNVNTVR